MAPPLRDGHRQIIEMRLIGDAKLERGAFKLLPSGWIQKTCAEQEACHARGEDPTVALHFCHGPARELHCLHLDHRAITTFLATVEYGDQNGRSRPIR